MIDQETTRATWRARRALARRRERQGFCVLPVDADSAALASVLRVRGLLPADVQPSRQALAKFASLLLAEIALNPEVAQLNTTADYPAAVTDRTGETIADTCDALQDAGVAAGHVPFALFSASVAMLKGNMC